MDFAEQVAMATRALEDRGLQPGSFTVGHKEDGRACLLFENGRWVAAFFERGQLDVRFVEHDLERAITRFADWVAATEESTRRSSEATARWLKRMGKEPP